MKVLHVLDHYKPHFSGYVFRTSYILKHQRELGIEPVLVTSPKHGKAPGPLEVIDGMKVYRTLETEFGATPFVRERKLMAALEARINEAIEAERPDIVHAHSPSLNGSPALKAARRHGIPVVYEIRAFWEDAAVDHGTFAEGSLKYKVSRYLETRLLRGVDAAFTICRGLKEDIVGRGIPDSRVTIIPNCVDASSFSPLPFDSSLADKAGVRGKTVFGFIGSFYHYEGLDNLIESFPGVLAKVPGARLLLVGDGPEKAALFEKTQKTGLGGKVIFTGKVPHADVNRYYSIMDCLVYPRKSMRLTELVTPLKPLEAMAMGKLVAGSDVGGIRELVTDGRDGFLFRAGRNDELTALLVRIATDRAGTEPVAREGIRTALEKHDWKDAIARYVPVYNGLVKKELVCAG